MFENRIAHYSSKVGWNIFIERSGHQSEDYDDYNKKVLYMPTID